MDSMAAAVLGVVEGLTEFLPVSSTGHLILAGNLLDVHGPKAATFDVFIQLGAILSVLVLYRQRFVALIRPNPSMAFSGPSGLAKLFVGCLPAFVAGFLLHGAIKALFQPLTVALALLVGGIVMILVERRGYQPRVSSIDEISYRDAFAVGCFQCIALWPGFSRSASTIIGGMLWGLERKTAAEFSFLLAVPIMVAASGYDLIKNWEILSGADVWPFTVGFLLSFVTGIVAIKFFLSLLARTTLVPFGWYRIGVAVAVLVFMRG